MAAFEDSTLTQEETLSGFQPGEPDDDSFRLNSLESYPGELPDFESYSATQGGLSDEEGNIATVNPEDQKPKLSVDLSKSVWDLDDYVDKPAVEPEGDIDVEEPEPQYEEPADEDLDLPEEAEAEIQGEYEEEETEPEEEFEEYRSLVADDFTDEPIEDANQLDNKEEAEDEEVEQLAEEEEYVPDEEPEPSDEPEELQEAYDEDTLSDIMGDMMGESHTEEEETSYEEDVTDQKPYQYQEEEDTEEAESYYDRDEEAEPTVEEPIQIDNELRNLIETDIERSKAKRIKKAREVAPPPKQTESYYSSTADYGSADTEVEEGPKSYYIPEDDYLVDIEEPEELEIAQPISAPVVKPITPKPSDKAQLAKKPKAKKVRKPIQIKLGHGAKSFIYSSIATILLVIGGSYGYLHFYQPDYLAFIFETSSKYIPVIEKTESEKQAEHTQTNPRSEPKAESKTEHTTEEKSARAILAEANTIAKPQKKEPTASSNLGSGEMPSSKPSASKPRIKPEIDAKEPDNGIYTIQVYASPSLEDAEDWMRKLRKKNIQNAYISTQKVRDKIWYRVRFGKYPSREEARSAALRYGFAQTWIDRIK